MIKRFNSDHIAFAITMFIAIGIVVAIAVYGSRAINQAARECEAKGGVEVRTYGGFECIKAEVLP